MEEGAAGLIDLQARVVQKLLQKSMFFESLFLRSFWFDLGYPLGYHFGEKSIKVHC